MVSVTGLESKALYHNVRSYNFNKPVVGYIDFTQNYTSIIKLGGVNLCVTLYSTRIYLVLYYVACSSFIKMLSKVDLFFLNNERTFAFTYCMAI